MKKSVSFGVLAAACVMIFGGCSGNSTAVKGEAMDQSATSKKTALNPAASSNTSETETTSGTAAKLAKESASNMPMQANRSASSMAKQTNTATSTTTQTAMDNIKSDLETIYFDFDSAALSQQSRKALTSNSDYLKKHSDVRIRIEGNCDERGSAEYNIALGEKRAKAALKYITTLGIDDNRLSIVSNGNEKPIAQGHDESAWAKNRRDDFIILSK